MFIILSAFIIVGTWLDVATTLYGYRRYRLREANAIWRAFLTRPTLFYAAETAFWAAMVAALFVGRATMESFVVTCAFRFGVVLWNLVQIREGWKAKR